MTDRGWEAALDAYEARLVDQRAALDSSDVEVAPFVPPTGLGPVPAGLTDRARAVLADSRALEAELAARTAAASLVADVAPRAATSTGPAFLDQRV